MAQNIEIFPGVTIDLNEGLERGDLIDGKTRVEHEDALLAENPEGQEEQDGQVRDVPAVVEGKETVKPEEVKTEEPAKPPTTEEEESLQTFKIKYAGEEKELKLTQEQLIQKLQKAEDYDKKMAKLADDRREVEPFKHILDTPWFKARLQEGLESGEISKPAEAPPAPEEAIFELERRKLDPDFENVREAMRNWSLQLPVTMQHQLDSNVVVFNREYDRIAEKLRAPKHTPPLTLTPKQEKQVDKVIQAKEKAKESAKVESPGSTTELDPNKARDTRVRELKRLMKQGGTRTDDYAAEYLLLTRFSG